MKKSFFFAAAAAMFMVSCNQVEIDSNAGKLTQNNEGQTVIGAEIVDYKTVLGTPEDNVYPINWQEGDAICVNAATSNALAASDFSGKKATFTFGEELTSPYWAVYPASAAGTFGLDGADVTVPSVQGYVAGSFDPAAAIMLGKGEEGISFVNAMAYIKVKTTGTEKISNVVVTSLGAEAMSGEFTTADFQTIAPKEGGNTSISVVLVTETPVDAGTDLIVAIPAQTYASGFMISIQSPDGKVYQKKSEKSFAPVAGHMYAVTLAYAPVAVEGKITVDGDFSDWQTVPCVSYTIPARNATFTNIVKMSYTADDDYVYGCMVMDETYPGYSTFFDLFVDADGDVQTGGKLLSIENYSGYPFADSGVEWYIEGGLYDASTQTYGDYFTKWHYIGEDGANVFSGLSNITGEFTTDHFAVIGASNGKGVGRFEFKMQREKFEMLGEKAAFGCKNLCNGVAGLLPQSSDFVSNRLPMAAITMKESSHKPQPEPEPIIKIDGDFSDWEAVKANVQTYNLPAGALLPNAHSMSFIADDNYVYVKLDAKDNKDGSGVVLDFFIDSDGDSATGMCMNELGSVGVSGNMFLSSGVDWYMQSSLYNGASYFNLVKPGYFLHCIGGFGLPYGGGAVCENHGADCDASRSIAAISGTEDGNLHMEWRLSREFFGMTGPKARFGLRYGCPGWTVSGAMPQGPAEDGVYTKANLFTVLLPSDQPVVEEPISIDGEFDDWDEAPIQTYEVPEDAKYNKLYFMDVAASSKYVYLRLNGEYNTLRTRTYLVLNTDGNWDTGFKFVQGSDVLAVGCERHIETYLTDGAKCNNFNTLINAYLWNGKDGATYSAGSCTDYAAGVTSAISNGATVITGNDIMTEWRLDRKFFGITGNTLGLCVRFYHGWNMAGNCPQKSAEDGKFVMDKWLVNLPTYSE